MNTSMIPVALSSWQIGVGITLLFVLIVYVFIVSSFFSIWLRAFLAGAPIKFPRLIAMRLRGVPVSLIIDAHITSVKAGVSIDVDNLEAHHLAGGNVIETVQAVIAADKADVEFDWQHACAIDLASKITGKSVLEELQNLL